MKISLATRCAVAGLALAAAAVPALAGRQKTLDPFARPVKPNTPVAKPKENIIAPPVLADRQTACKSSVPAGSQVESLPCMYLVREVTLEGVFRTGDQTGAFLYAAPTKQTITVHVGDKLFDGRVVSITEPGPNGNGQIVLEKVTKRQVAKKVTETTELVQLQLTSAGM